MPHRPLWLGVGVGILAAAVILAMAGRGPTAIPDDPTGPILSDCDGAIGELVIQYTIPSADIIAPVYREFLGQLPADVTVHVVCPDAEAMADLESRIGPVACKLSPIITGHEISGWSRDRWIALASAHDGLPVTLVRPRGEEAAEVWPARAGDQRIAGDIAAALPAVSANRSELYFDGGDFAADSDVAFVTPALLGRNLGRTVADRAELLRRLEGLLKRKVVLLDEAPPHHAGMYMMPAGGGVVVVGDPSLARDMVAAGEMLPNAMSVPADFSAATQELFDAVADQCAAAGGRVIRIPVMPGADGRTYFTYLNVIIDERAGGRVVYMPVYDGAEAMNESAAEVWRGLGYEVRPVNCTSAYVHFGSLRCLVNVLRRR